MFEELDDDLMPGGVLICKESILQLREFVVRVSFQLFNVVVIAALTALNLYIISLSV